MDLRTDDCNTAQTSQTTCRSLLRSKWFILHSPQFPWSDGILTARPEHSPTVRFHTHENSEDCLLKTMTTLVLHHYLYAFSTTQKVDRKLTQSAAGSWQSLALSLFTHSSSVPATAVCRKLWRNLRREILDVSLHLMTQRIKCARKEGSSHRPTKVNAGLVFCRTLATLNVELMGPWRVQVVKLLTTHPVGCTVISLRSCFAISSC
jgi:hypothetical protein